ncbi:MAG: GNAT family N-acetyltransferase [Deltaproteobacteria bacterium]|nr:MAG: GNAT family N-acetyltransferase [Deltaproteobacteria bacterium]
MTSTDESLSQNSSITIRDCTLKDASTIAGIYNDYVHSGGSTMDTEEKSNSDIEAQIQKFSDRETILVLEKEGTFLGWGIIKQYSDRVGYRFCCETSVYVLVHERKRRTLYHSRLFKKLHLIRVKVLNQLSGH